MRRLAFIAFALALASYSSDAFAVVEQVDGTVMPIFNAATCPSGGSPISCVPTALNIGEGLPATSSTNPLNAVLDAATSPEVFAIPQTGGVYGTVKVTDLVEGAGFENSFGWYNVDAPNTLYVITPCADEPTSVRNVNFQTEFTAGRYLGGFIGFFLITPENQPVANNCGSLGDVGHLYYTEQAKNGDGNYVHYLIYTSKVDNKRFYFGFEDLFRGGDNDFEDMFLQVDGLVVACQPTAEICDGKDNNCDGLVDNNPVDAGTPCGVTDTGACKLGIEVCQNGGLLCVGAILPSPEVCNGIDDNCNAVIDDSPFGEGANCGSNVGACLFGAQTCVGGVFVCVGGKGPTNEICNVIDDDCNGAVDDNTIDSGGPCGSNVGACSPGILACTVGMVTCQGGMLPGLEVCNGVDDDCNGAVDDGDPGGGAACGIDTGTCKSGLEHCVGGAVVCVGSIGPTPEICDGLDNDCDGTGDNLATCPNGSQCIQGNCAAPCGQGEFPCPGGQQCISGFCEQVSCADVTCKAGDHCENGVCIPDSSTQSGSSGAGGQASNGATTSTTGAGAEGGAGIGGPSSRNTWGLATGGGGLQCSASPTGSASLSTLIAMAIAGLSFSRRRARRASGEV